MQLTVTTEAGGMAKSGVDVADSAFGVPYNEPLVHQVVTAYLAGARAGTRAQKSRSDVRGGGTKPWRQKGTGRARVGSIRSPLWRSGGVTFAARPQDWSQKVNKKMYRGALRSILSELARQDRLVVVEAFAVEAAKTKELVAKLGKLGLEKDVLVIVEDAGTDLLLSARNLHRVDVCDALDIDPVSLVAHDRVLVTLPALKRIEERLA